MFVHIQTIQKLVLLSLFNGLLVISHHVLPALRVGCGHLQDRFLPNGNLASRIFEFHRPNLENLDKFLKLGRVNLFA